MERNEKISKTMKGRKLSKEVKKNISNAKMGSKNPAWKGGITKDWKKYKRFMDKRRRLTKANTRGTHSLGEWELLKKQYGHTCPCCKKQEPGIKLTEDHIIPLSRGGSDYIENIQPLCQSCNSKKYTKIIKYE